MFLSELKNRDKAILTGLYLSKFDNKAIEFLGFKSVNEAFNVLGYSIGVKPASIKNYRDEFDPYFPNVRKGWHKRTIREYCKQYLDEYSNVSFTDFTDLVKSFFIENYDVEKALEKKDEKSPDPESIAKRLMTGKAAEEYFRLQYKTIPTFQSYSLKDTRNNACGFDYILHDKKGFLCVEVKGLHKKSGNILMTDKEYTIAGDLRELFCLFVVRNFAEKPIHFFIFDPLNSELRFNKNERIIKQISYTSPITERL